MKAPLPIDLWQQPIEVTADFLRDGAAFADFLERYPPLYGIRVRRARGAMIRLVLYTTTLTPTQPTQPT